MRKIVKRNIMVLFKDEMSNTLEAGAEKWGLIKDNGLVRIDLPVLVSEEIVIHKWTLNAMSGFNN